MAEVPLHPIMLVASKTLILPSALTVIPFGRLTRLELRTLVHVANVNILFPVNAKGKTNSEQIVYELNEQYHMLINHSIFQQCSMQLSSVCLLPQKSSAWSE